MQPHDTREELKKRIGASIDALIDVLAMMPASGYSMSAQQLKISASAEYAYALMLHALKVTNEGIDE